ncbi:MAG: hypothetical protein JNL82_08175 [Myxococcales bacterium]|nr:hypothetical protein [Myxococcales bacterium]
MTYPLAIALFAVAAVACNAADAPPAPGSPPTAATTPALDPAPTNAGLPDLSQSLDGVRAAFNERSKEARFLALLAPT